MKTINISDARNRLPALIAAVAQTHEAVVLARYGKPLVTIVPYRKRAPQTRYPLRAQRIAVAKDFDAPMPELWKALGVAEKRAAYTAAPRRRRRRLATPKSA